MRYVALLRGVNVGGNNKVSMADLVKILTDAGLTNVRTYINSGNVLFESTGKNSYQLATLCEAAIMKFFGFSIDCVVLSAAEYKKEIDAAPKWWGTHDKDLRSDALFVLRSGDTQAVIDKVGEVNSEYEWIGSGGKVVFWTIDRRHYGKARLPKIIGSDVYRSFSMRSSTTTRKLYTLLEDK